MFVVTWDYKHEDKLIETARAVLRSWESVVDLLKELRETKGVVGKPIVEETEQ